MQHAGQMAVVVLILAAGGGLLGPFPRPPGPSSSASSGPGSKKDLRYVSHGSACARQSAGPARAVDCAVALRVEADYTRELAAGEAPGNGGGGTMPVDGWTCRGTHPANLADRAGIGVP